MSPTFVSTQSLGEQPPPAADAGAGAAHDGDDRGQSTGQYADLGLQLGDQSGYELSLKEQVQQLAGADRRQQRRRDQSLDGAGRARPSISSTAQTTVAGSRRPGRRAPIPAPHLQTMGQTALQELIASANATSGDAYVFGGINRASRRWRTISRRRLRPPRRAVDQAFQTTFGFRRPIRPRRASPPRRCRASSPGRSPRCSPDAPGRSDWSSASSANTTAEIAPGQTATTSTNAEPARRFQQLTEAYTMLAEFGGSSLSLSAQQAVASAATSLIAQGQDALTNAQATLGATQSAGHRRQQLDELAADAACRPQIGNLDNVDPDGDRRRRSLR